ncbi:hypothetical protein [Sphingobacterium spiritivorum]
MKLSDLSPFKNNYFDEKDKYHLATAVPVFHGNDGPEREATDR